jgi:Methylamine utilisation protein MauE
MLAVAREVQIPLLAVLLIGGCVAKGRRAIGARSIDAGIGPTALFPRPMRRSVAIAISGVEFVLGIGLLVTAGRIGIGWPVITVRWAAALLFCTAVAALQELRTRRPDAGCGCFGDLSGTPVNWRTITRAALLGAVALASIGAPPLRMPSSSGQAGELLALVLVELALLAALSPEIGQLMVRLGHSEPCEVRRVPVARTLSTLRASSPWRRYRPHLISTTPTDVWREGCWRFAAYPGVLASRRVEVVFAVYLMGRRAPVRAGVLEVDTPAPPALARRYSSLTVYKKNPISMNRINITSNGPRLLWSGPLGRSAAKASRRLEAGEIRRVGSGGTCRSAGR